MVAEILSWLDGPSAERIRERTATWSQTMWSTCFTALRMHGIAAFLKHTLTKDDQSYNLLPHNLQEYLNRFSTALAARNQRMLEELDAILDLAAQQGIPVMPLKGSLLGVLFYESPLIRPMADLDLLVKPEHEQGLVGVLGSLGYESLYPDNPAARERHLRMQKPGNEQVFSWDLPHPDNPRPVELHSGVSRMLWGDVKIADASQSLWSGAKEVMIRGKLAFVPAPPALLAHQALHATDHMALQSARAIQFVDLSILAARGVPLPEGAMADWIFPSMTLARRCMPSAWEGLDLHDLEQRTDRNLAAWAKHVPLDHRGGLVTDPTPPGMRPWRRHWERWWPSPWRLRLGYPGAPLPLSFLRHAGAMLRQLARKFLG